MNTGKVESVNVDQSLLGHLFGYGTVTVHGAGGSLEPLPNIARPIAVPQSRDRRLIRTRDRLLR
jgi:uncharacterized membrane protein YdbT with pleckstrin-like domain